MAADRQLPLYFVVGGDHAGNNGDLSLLVDDLNEALADEPGFKKLSVDDFIALNADVLDADAKARGFDRGARWETEDADGKKVSGYHVFAGAQVLAGYRETAATTKSKAAAKAADSKS